MRSLICVLLVVGLVRASVAADFLETCAQKAADAEKRKAAVIESQGMLFLSAELRHLGAGKFWGDNAAKVSRAPKPEWADPLPAILDFKAQLEARGIALLVAPVPPKSLVYADKLGGALQSRADRWHSEFYEMLKSNGVEVLDLAPSFLAARTSDSEAESVYCATDSHWSPKACALSAKSFSEWLVKKNVKPEGVSRACTESAQTLSFTGDLARLRDPESKQVETQKARQIQTANGVVDEGSPVLLLGDSHCLVFHAGGDMLASGAGLADQLAFTWGGAVDVLGVRGSGATPARVALLQRVRANDEYLAKKKAVIWCFAARELTEASGWRKVPLGSK